MLPSTDKRKERQTIPLLQLLARLGMTIIQHDRADLSGRYLQHVNDIGDAGAIRNFPAGGDEAVFTEAGEKFDRDLHGVLPEPDKPEPEKKN
jgi:hypothetical protein